LLRDLDTDRALFESVLKRMKETDLTKGIQADPVQIVEAASFNPGPIRPDRTRALTTGIMLGLAAGLGIILLLMYLDSSVKTVDQSEKVFGLPTLAAVPQLKDISQSTTLVMARDPNSVVAESFRSLRASLALLGPEAIPQPIIQKLSAKVIEILKMTDVKERFAAGGVSTIPSTPDELAARIKRELAMYRGVIEKANVHVD